MISRNIDENRAQTIKVFNSTSDLVLYEFETNSCSRILIAYLDGLVDKSSLDRDLIKPMMENFSSVEYIKNTVYISSVNEIYFIEDIVKPLVNGSVILFIDESNIAYSIDLSHWEKRTLEEPNSEAVVRGPKEGFIEDIATNKVLIRRRIRNSKLVFEDYTLGVETNTRISLVYIMGIVNEEVLEELRSRIDKIDTDAILETGYIEQFIEDEPKSIISTIGNSQKPDVIAGKILEGRIGILCDGTPHVLTVPKLFIEDTQTAEDYYLRPVYATFLRSIRIFSLFMSIVLPGLYVALQTYHQEMIPTLLLISMAGAREGVPLPAVLEALLMTLMLELIKESGIRLPRAVGSAVSIVGALVLGQAAVEAGIVSAPMVIITAVTGIAEFAIPSLTEAIIIYRILIIILGGFMGLYGITCGFVVFMIQIMSLKSFGVSYFYPIAPYEKQGMKDVLIRFPLKQLIYRPKSLAKGNARKKRNEKK
ncbi:spore germination protein [Tissierella sp. MSJ-40]|uniref:Spore germination protein n=1 Tax=Tissierella simiarum TaxID=2841534 RepID=A0ABS6E9X2_9FIRM|nr:spore germination protein [Tissierella simiarum]MBU5438998.1 spore germination protein [Tissierella simiarum]